MRLDGVRFSVVDVGAALRAYRVLLGAAPVGIDGGVERFQLGRGAIELTRGTPAAAACFAVERGDDLGAWPTSADVHGGLDVLVTSEPRIDPTPPEADGVAAIDHIVVRTPDPARAIAHWRDQLGLRLALDKEFPERGLRLQFFRSGGITLEFVSTLGEIEDDGVADVVYGVSYRVPDLAACRERLTGAGLDVAEIADGHKPGTRVATVRSGTQGVPTLLIEHVEGP